MTKETVDVIGYFLPTDLPNDGADIVLGQGFGISRYSRKLKLPITVKDEVKSFGKTDRIDPENFFERQPDGKVRYFVDDFSNYYKSMVRNVITDLKELTWALLYIIAHKYSIEKLTFLSRCNKRKNKTYNF